MAIVIDKILGGPLLHNHGLLVFTDFGSLPVASAAYRGYLVYVYGSEKAIWDSTTSSWDDVNTNWDDTTDTTDRLYLCHRKSDGTYEWLDLTV